MFFPKIISPSPRATRVIFESDREFGRPPFGKTYAHLWDMQLLDDIRHEIRRAQSPRDNSVVHALKVDRHSLTVHQHAALRVRLAQRGEHVDEHGRRAVQRCALLYVQRTQRRYAIE